MNGQPRLGLPSAEARAIAERKDALVVPTPDTYLAATQALAVDPAHAVVFEDALAGVGLRVDVSASHVEYALKTPGAPREPPKQPPGREPRRRSPG